MPCCSSGTCRTYSPATAVHKRRLGKGLQKRRWWNWRSSPQEVGVRSACCMLCAIHASTGYATGPHISAARITSSSTCAWLLSEGSEGMRRAGMLLISLAVRLLLSVASAYALWRRPSELYNLRYRALHTDRQLLEWEWRDDKASWFYCGPYKRLNNQRSRVAVQSSP